MSQENCSNCTNCSSFLKNKHTDKFIIPGFNLLAKGKVRNSFEIPNNPKLMAVVATDRVSIFDFILPAEIPGKGEILTALTYFWLTQVVTEHPNHLAFDMFDYVELLPKEFKHRTLVVQKLTMILYEFIFRGHLGGSVYDKEYTKSGTAAGLILPTGIKKWEKLNAQYFPVFTPSTKAEKGHDVNLKLSDLPTNSILDATIDMLRNAYCKAYKHASQKGILILDSKFEAAPGIIADEVLTPDSSRFVEKKEWEKAMCENRDPAFYDKEITRRWGRTVQSPFDGQDGQKIVGINNLDPSNPDHLNFVNNLTVPKEIITNTADKYHQIFEKLTGFDLEHFQETFF